MNDTVESRNGTIYILSSVCINHDYPSALVSVSLDTVSSARFTPGHIVRCRFFMHRCPLKPASWAFVQRPRKAANSLKHKPGLRLRLPIRRNCSHTPEIDIIHCCTPNDAHAVLLLSAIQAGKHIYCDKPLTRTLAEAQAVTAAAVKSTAIHRMTFHYRFAPATLRAKQLVESGFLGELYHFRAAYLHAGYLDPARPRTWRLEMARSGGGALMDLGAHVFDLTRWLVGEFDSVSATLVTRINERPDPCTGAPAPVDVDDIALIQARTQSGAIGIIEASRLATGVQDELRIELHGSKGAISWNLMEPNFLSVYDARSPEEPLGGDRGVKQIECVSRYPQPFAFKTNKNTLGWNQMHAHSVFDFVSAVATGADETGPTFVDGLAANAFVHACQESAGADGAWRKVKGEKY